MLATLARKLPRDDGRWAYEFKWDGVRALVFVEDGKVRIQGRSRRDFTGQYPEVTGLGTALADRGRVTRSSTARSWPSAPTARPASRPCSAACTWSRPTTC